MTCIAAARDDDGRLWMASDSLVRMGNHQETGVEGLTKVFRKEDFLIGVAGRTNVKNLLRHRFSIPLRRRRFRAPFGKIPGNDHYIYVTFSDALRTFLKKQGEFAEGGGMTGNSPAQILVGTRWGIFQFFGGVTPLSAPKEGVAIGSGSQYAAGVLWALSKTPAKERVVRAVEAACRYDKGCGGKITTISLDPE